MYLPPLLLQLGANQANSALWMVGGISILGLSFLIPRPSIAAMGVSAILTGLFALAIPSLTFQLIVWTILFVIQTALLPRFLPRRARVLRQSKVAKVVQEITAGGVGQVDYQGTLWNARCQEADLAIAPDQTVRVLNRDGTTLIVMPDNASGQNNNIANRAD